MPVVVPVVASKWTITDAPSAPPLVALLLKSANARCVVVVHAGQHEEHILVVATRKPHLALLFKAENSQAHTFAQ